MTLLDSNPDKRPLAEPDSAKVALGSDLPAGPEDPGPSGSASRPRPDYDPHQDHPERFTEGPI